MPCHCTVTLSFYHSALNVIVALAHKRQPPENADVDMSLKPGHDTFGCTRHESSSAGRPPARPLPLPPHTQLRGASVSAGLQGTTPVTAPRLPETQTETDDPFFQPSKIFDGEEGSKLPCHVPTLALFKETATPEGHSLQSHGPGHVETESAVGHSGSERTHREEEIAQRGVDGMLMEHDAHSWAQCIAQRIESEVSLSPVSPHELAESARRRMEQIEMEAHLGLLPDDPDSAQQLRDELFALFIVAREGKREGGLDGQEQIEEDVVTQTEQTSPSFCGAGDSGSGITLQDARRSGRPKRVARVAERTATASRGVDVERCEGDQSAWSKQQRVW